MHYFANLVYTKYYFDLIRVHTVILATIRSCRSLDKMSAYKSSHIRSAVRGQSRWSGFLSSSLPKRGSTGANLDSMATASLFSAGDKSSSPFTCPVDIHDAIPLLPIDLGLAKTYRYIACLYVYRRLQNFRR